MQRQTSTAILAGGAALIAGVGLYYGWEKISPTSVTAEMNYQSVRLLATAKVLIRSDSAVSFIGIWHGGFK